MPAALVWGAADQFQKVGYGYPLAHDLRTRLERIEGGRHFVPEDHPDRIASVVKGLLASTGGLDETAVWQWGYLERVSTGLYALSLGAESQGRQHLRTAESLCDVGPDR